MTFFSASHLLLALLLLLLPFGAHAHMSISPRTAVSSSRATFRLRISHDCGDATIGTSNFTVAPPEGMLNVRAEQMADWRTVFTRAPLDPPVTRGGTSYNETVIRVTFLGFLPDGLYRTFGISGIMPLGTGTVYFKGYQDCYGEEHDLAWDMLPSPDNPRPRYPAVGVRLTRQEDGEDD